MQYLYGQSYAGHVEKMLVVTFTNVCHQLGVPSGPFWVSTVPSKAVTLLTSITAPCIPLHLTALANLCDYLCCV